MSKNLQINYTVALNDLTPAQIASHIANMKRLAKAQHQIDRDRILNRQATLEKIALAKAAQLKKESAQKETFSDLQRYRQLLGRKAVMEKAHQLRKLRGDEAGLKKYMMTQQGLLTKLQQKTFSSKEYRARADNLTKQLAIQGRINQAEMMLGSAITANTRRRERELRMQERQLRAAARLRQEALNRSAQGAAAIGVGAGFALHRGARGMGYSFGKTMDYEQLRIAMQAQFGEREGVLVFDEMKKYAIQTMFRMEDTIQLLLDVKKGAENIGLKNTRDIIEFTKAVGKPLLSFAVNKEKRAEAGYQLGQIFMAGTADERQDIKVMARAGIPIYAALNKMTGKTIKELKDLYGAQLPATLIAQAMLFLNQSQENMLAMAKYEKSFTIAWQASTEQFMFLSGAFGEKVAEAMKIPQLLRLATNVMGDIEESFNKGGGSIATYLLAVGGISAGLLTLKGLIMGSAYAMQFLTRTAIVTNGVLGTFLNLSKALLLPLGKMFLISSFLYLAFADWKNILGEANSELEIMGMKLEDIMKIVGTAGGAVVGGLLGGPVGAVLGGYGVNKYLSYKINEAKDEIKMDKFLQAQSQISTPSMSLWNQSPDYFSALMQQKMFPVLESPAMTPIPAKPEYNFDIKTIVEPNTGATRTKVNVKSPYDNPTYNFWQGGSFGY